MTVVIMVKIELSKRLYLPAKYIVTSDKSRHDAGSSLLGRAKQLGPHSFVQLSLFPANDQLELAVPSLQTSFQAQTFCPEFHFRRQLPVTIDARMVHALATQVFVLSCASPILTQVQESVITHVCCTAQTLRQGITLYCKTPFCIITHVKPSCLTRAPHQPHLLAGSWRDSADQR